MSSDISKKLIKDWRSIVLVVGFILFLAVVLPWLGFFNASMIFFGFAFFLSVALVRLTVTAFRKQKYWKLAVTGFLALLIIAGSVQSLVLLFLAGKLGLSTLIVFIVVGAIMFTLPAIITRYTDKVVKFDGIKGVLGWRPEKGASVIGLGLKALLSVLFLATTLFSGAGIMHVLSGAATWVYLACIPTALLFAYAAVFSLGCLTSAIYSAKLRGNLEESLQQEVNGMTQEVTQITEGVNREVANQSANVVRQVVSHQLADQNQNQSQLSDSESPGIFSSISSWCSGLFRNRKPQATDEEEPDNANTSSVDMNGTGTGTTTNTGGSSSQVTE